MSYDSQVATPSRVEFGPAPAAFDMTAVAFGDRDPRALSSNGLCYWKSHSQFDISGPEPVHTSRSVWQVTGHEGLQAAASFTAIFNPKYERLVIHAVRVHRAGDIREAGMPEAFEVIQRELNMERAVYDGRMTAHMVIPDVREGDIVETVYSTIGANPALKSKFAWRFILQWAVPVVETRCTIRVAPDRELAIRSQGSEIPPVDEVHDGVRVLDWTARDVPTYVTDPGAPPWFTGFSSVHVADEGSWADVADIFRPYYEGPADLPADLADQVDALKAAEQAPEQRVVAALRLVQSSVRYHSVSIGEGGYRPRPVADIWQTRYGDCKDVSVLLTAMLRAMEIDAVCALVDTVAGEDLSAGLAHVMAFNHCIVRVRLDGETYWLDPTSAPQAGDLARLTQAAFGHALPLVAQADLEIMPELPQVTVCDTVETWSFHATMDKPADLAMTTTYRSWRADSTRHWIANQGHANMAKAMKEGLEKELRSPLVPLADVTVVDDVASNQLVVREHYSVENPFNADRYSTGERFYSRDDIVGPQLSELGPDERRAPLQLGLRRRVATQRIFRFANHPSISEWQERVTGPSGLVLDTSFEWRTPTEAVHNIALTVGQRYLPAEEAQAYRTFVTQARNLNGISFSLAPGQSKKSVKSSETPWGWIIWIGVVLVLIISRVLTG